MSMFLSSCRNHISKVEEGKMELELSPVVVGNLIEQSLMMVRERCLKHGITLDLEIDDGLKDTKMPVDSRKFRQIMFNLLSNASKFTPDGGSIAVRARSLGRGEIEISVSDTGIGIRKEDQEKIFEPFYQVKSGAIEKIPGTGLGLSLTKKIVELHGGRIWVESEEGKGSTFYVSIKTGNSLN